MVLIVSSQIDILIIWKMLPRVTANEYFDEYA